MIIQGHWYCCSLFLLTSSYLHVILDVVWYLSPHFPVNPGQEAGEFSSLEALISRIAVQLLIFSMSSVLRVLQRAA